MGCQAALPSPPPEFGSDEIAGSWAQRRTLGKSFSIALLRGEFSPLPLAPVFAGAILLELHGVPCSAAIAPARIWIRRDRWQLGSAAGGESFVIALLRGKFSHLLFAPVFVGAGARRRS